PTVAVPEPAAAESPMAAYFAALQRSQPATAAVPPGFINPAVDAIAEAAADQDSFHGRVVEPAPTAFDARADERGAGDDERGAGDEPDDEPSSTSIPTVITGAALPLGAQLAPPARS